MRHSSNNTQRLSTPPAHALLRAKPGTYLVDQYDRKTRRIRADALPLQVQCISGRLEGRRGGACDLDAVDGGEEGE